MTEEHKRKISIALKGIKRPIFSKEHRRKIGLAGLGRTAWNKGLKNWMSEGSKARTIEKLMGRIAWNKGLKGYMAGEKHYYWKGGVSKTKEYVRLCHFKRRCKIGTISIKTIQLLYEDNIKKYGTLTCYLCYKPVEFKQDCIEHKTPISRGGTNEYNNLAIAHRTCNSKKHKKTETEYRKENGDL